MTKTVIRSRAITLSYVRIDRVLRSSRGGELDTRRLRNFGDNGKSVGSSQVTAVVERTSHTGDGRLYPITARATLVAPYAVQLAHPRLLSPHEKLLLDKVSLKGKTSADFLEVARQLRLPGRPGQNPSQPKILIASHPVLPSAALSNGYVSPEMRHHAAVRTTNHFGFTGNRSAISLLYARREGATQGEVNEAGKALGSRQKNYLNMLHKALEWGHRVEVWDDPVRKGQVYKLFYNPNHSGPGAVSPPNNWKEMNIPKLPLGVNPTPYKPNRS